MDKPIFLNEKRGPIQTKHEATDLTTIDYLAARFLQTERRFLALAKATSDVIYRMSPDWKIMIRLYGNECIKEKKAFELKHRIFRKDGGIGWAHSKVIPLLNDDGSIWEWYGATSDISAHKRSEEALRENELMCRCSMIADAAKEGIIYTEPNGTCLYSNKRFSDMLGYTKKEILGKTCTDFCFVEECSQIFQLRGTIKKGEVLQGEFRFRHKDGSKLWTKFNAHPVFSAARDHIANFIVCTDITERKKMGEMLRKNEEKQSYLLKLNDKLRSLSDVQLIRDTAICLLAEHLRLSQSSYAEHNENYVIIKSKAQNNNILNIKKTYRKEDLSACIDILLSDGNMICSDVLKDSSIPEKLRDLLLSLNIRANITVPIFRGKKLVASLFAHQFTPRIWSPDEVELVHETAERVWVEIRRAQAEEALRKSKEKLRRANKNKNNFISMLSHELRNPLAVITAGISLLQESDDKLQTEKVQEIMKRQSNQLCKLVDDLLDLTRITQNRFQLNKKNINLRDLTINVAKDITRAFEVKNIHFSVEIQEKPILIYADPVRITQSIENLLHNALKFTPSGGTVLFSLKQEKAKAVIKVKDNGIGIKQNLLPHLFKPFKQANNSLDRQNNAGLGLGLSIVKGIVETHKGTIAASSGGPGKGTSFTMRLPVIIENIEVPDNNIAVPYTRVYKILIIEDNKELAKLLCFLLNSLGHKTFAVHDGIEGIARARKIQPDIIFCDIGLPGMNGYEVAKAIRRDNSLKKILLVSLTGYADKSNIKRAQESEFDDHIAKPVSLDMLKQFLNNLLITNKKDKNIG